MFIHYSRWPFKNEESEHTVEGKVSPTNSHIIANSYNKTESSSEVKEYLMNWLSVSADNIVILILLLALAIKFIFFEDKGDIAKQLRFKEEDDTDEKVESEYATSENMNTATMNMSLRQRFGDSMPPMRSAVFPLSGVGGGWIDVDNEYQMEFIDKEVQTDGKQFSADTLSTESLPLQSKVPRSLEECLEIYKSEVSEFVIETSP